MREVAVIGVGMTKFGVLVERSLQSLGVEACQNALRDASLPWPAVEIAYCAAVLQGAAPGTRVLENLGMTGIPIINVENASASGSTAFREAYVAVASGLYDTALALGIGKMHGNVAMGVTKTTREDDLVKARGNPNPVAHFAMKTRRRLHEFGSSIDSFANVAVKNRKHASLNPYAQFQKEITLEDVRSARMICDPMTLLHMCPVTDGAAAVVLCTADKARQLTARPLITVAASVFRTQAYRSRTFPGPNVTEVAAKEAYEQSGLGPWDLDLVQVHEAAAIEEIEDYEFLGFCKLGEGERLVDEGATRIGGKIPFSTDGGLLSRGHPIGPTGLAQIWETVVQLRGQAGPRQVQGAKAGMAHMIGVGDVCIIHILKR